MSGGGIHQEGGVYPIRFSPPALQRPRVNLRATPRTKKVLKNTGGRDAWPGRRLTDSSNASVSKHGLEFRTNAGRQIRL